MSPPSVTVYTNHPFRAAHVGSLLRPKPLYKKRQELEAGKCDGLSLKDVENEAIKHVLKLQQNVGIKLVTDGELRRGYFFDGVFEKLEGMTYVPNRTLFSTSSLYPNTQGLLYSLGPISAFKGKVRRTQPFYVDDFKFLKSLVAPEV
ncbi:Putative protein YxjH [Psilocybe cubensis]|uniref:Uncharacterized protein n=1 Tax=Psilocybe cubensis TaxID=181762 RepID=A0ACB8HGQ5_PSICU|nr:Putative protein YxjH [Psilocybe cubensis]KAH9487003.1 Putative protein YxjH [Psilocybe cubensis]